MWLYTSYAVQPHRSVASKNGDFRYHGPKYKVLEVTSGTVLASLLTADLPSTGVRAPEGRAPRYGVCPCLPLRLNSCSIRSVTQGGNRNLAHCQRVGAVAPAVLGVATACLLP